MEYQSSSSPKTLVVSSISIAQVNEEIVVEQQKENFHPQSELYSTQTSYRENKLAIDIDESSHDSKIRNCL